MSVLKRLPHRDWLALRDHWVAYLPPVDFDAIYPEPTLWQLPGISAPQVNASGFAEFPYIEGAREAIFREAILLSRKFIYCGTVLPTLANVGKNTWTAITAYETSFYAAKTFCYLMGFASLGRDSKMYVDAFNETERKVGKSKEKFYDTLRAYKLPERLTHEMLWALTARLIDTTKFEGELRELQTQLRVTDWREFTRFRNKVFYDGSFWPLHTDVAKCDLVRSAYSSDIARAAWLQLESAPPVPFAENYFAVARLFRQLLTGMFQNIADLAPAIAREAEAFIALQQTSA